MQIRKAERRKSKLRLGISGPSGAGKTLSALLVAYGITNDWDKVGFIDTEQRSGDLYAQTEKAGVYIGEFLKIDLDPPYEPEKYIKAIRMLEEAGAAVIIIDSLTHAWAGDGGLLDIQGKIADSGRGNSFTAWRTVTPRHNALVDGILQSKSHIIATVRSKTEYVQQQGSNGKAEIKKVGMAPIQRDGMEYEFTTFLDLSLEHVASASKDRTSLFDGRFVKLTPETGKELLNWLETGSEAKEEPILARGGVVQLGAIWTGDGTPEKLVLPEDTAVKAKPATEATLKKLNTVISKLSEFGGTREQIVGALKQKPEIGAFESTKDLTQAQASAAIKYVEGWIKQKERSGQQ